MRITIRVIVFVILLLLFNGYSIAMSVNLADNGVFTEAKVLTYAPYKTGRSTINNYLILYDNYTAGIVLWGRDHPVNSKVSVVYDKNNPSLVWLGNIGDDAWEVYKSNYDPKGTIIAAVVFVILCIVEQVYIFPGWLSRKFR
ncbi:MAG: hypothetical protein H6Q74_2476 [Firmicutes bacterium]|nr:hypothetical protein [Bacillota bacterium]